MDQPRPLTAEQHLIVATVLRHAAALELALGNPQAAGMRLVEFIAESAETRQVDERRVRGP